jgi:hypothetical protein
MTIEEKLTAIIKGIDDTAGQDPGTRATWLKGQIVDLVVSTMAENAGALVAGQLRIFLNRKYEL